MAHPGTLGDGYEAAAWVVEGLRASRDIAPSPFVSPMEPHIWGPSGAHMRIRWHIKRSEGRKCSGIRAG